MTTSVPPTRCHLHLPITNSAGEVFQYAWITLNDADTGQQLTVDVYVQPEDGQPIEFPLFINPAVIDLWTDEPIRVQVIANLTNNVRIVLDGVDIMPPADTIMRTPDPLTITGSEVADDSYILMLAEPGHAAFRSTDPASIHQHEGDSAGSVVLNGEAPTDFNPYQTWVGYNDGQNTSPSSSGATGFGANAELNGASSTIMGIGSIVPQTSTGISGDMATNLSSEAGTATAGSTVIGPANQTAQGKDMTVLGGLTSMSGPSAVPNGATILGAGNVIGAAGAVKLGPNHPASDAGPNHVSVGQGNTAQNNSLPWAGAQTPFTLGTTTVTLAGDPSDQASADDWFGGVGPLAMGTNSTTFNPSIGLVQGNAVTQTALRAVGDVVVNGQRTYSNTTTTLGFFGTTGTARPQVAYSNLAPDNLVLDQLLTALSNLGLIYTNSTPVVSESGSHVDGTQLEFAETGQALQWKLPSASPMYRAANPFTIASGRVVLNAANAPFPTRGVPGLYSAGLSDASAQGVFGWNPNVASGTNIITNSIFDANITGWALWDAGTTVAWDGTKALYGGGSLKVGTSSPTADWARAAWQFDVTAGTQLNWSSWVNPQQNFPVIMRVEWFDSSWNYLSSTPMTTFSPTTNSWTRVNIGGTAPASTAHAAATVGYANGVGPLGTSASINIDGAMVQTGTTALPSFVMNSGYHPDDLATGLMIRSVHLKSISGGQTIVNTNGYLVNRTSVYRVSDNTIAATVATHSTPVSAGQVLTAACSGTSVVIKADGTQISTFTDSTFTSRVKFGYRLAPTTNVSGFLITPYGF